MTPGAELLNKTTDRINLLWPNYLGSACTSVRTEKKLLCCKAIIRKMSNKKDRKCNRKVLTHWSSFTFTCQLQRLNLTTIRCSQDGARVRDFHILGLLSVINTSDKATQKKQASDTWVNAQSYILSPTVSGVFRSLYLTTEDALKKYNGQVLKEELEYKRQALEELIKLSLRSQCSFMESWSWWWLCLQVRLW